jgi:hypothetical protein
MAVGSNLSKKRDFGFFRVNHGRRVKFMKKRNLGIFSAQLMTVGSNLTKKWTFGFFRAKSWS